ncbi:phage holin family protein [Acidipila sp. EB88]|uniref:phage holin family protein n=1 Tax=Acidipila sp. EB88 TaxID=2305226 RepID=UPI000F5E38EB|nr:phage holin family protein [Acidipila sp. EB88]RRA47735.1 hypothetical protein D1Y84_04920 [Acidipila sp. EB88]
MILTLFSFGLSWAIYAFAFVLLAGHLSGFHSAYLQSTFTVGFIVGFLNAAIIKMARVMAFDVPAVLLYFIIFVADFLMIMATSNLEIGYYVTGHKSATIAAAVLAIVAFVTEFVKEKFRADARGR